MSGKLIIELTSRECNRYLVEGGDIAVLPVGSVAVLGPHLPVGARYYVAEAFGQLLAEQVDGIRMPVTPFGVALATFNRAGSVAVTAKALRSYIRAAMDDLLVAGFRRILLLTEADYIAYYTPQEFYEDHNVAAAGINLGEAIYPACKAREISEDSVMVGALRVLGKHDLAAKVMAENARLLSLDSKPVTLPEDVARVLKGGVVGFTYPTSGFPIQPNPGLNPEAGAEALRESVAALVPAVASLRLYNEFLAKRKDSRGMMWRGWRWTE